jgi:hypothetical protein
MVTQTLCGGGADRDSVISSSLLVIENHAKRIRNSVSSAMIQKIRQTSAPIKYRVDALGNFRAMLCSVRREAALMAASRRWCWCYVVSACGSPCGWRHAPMVVGVGQ